MSRSEHKHQPRRTHWRERLRDGVAGVLLHGALCAAVLWPVRAPAGEARVPTEGATMIRRGERVALSARVGLVVATIEAEALQDGQKGEVIRVRSLQTGRVHRARVMDSGHVEVQP